jgi:secondary thiamine-phosphate synthase enzyme
MLYEYLLSASKENFYNITAQVREAVRKSGVTSGLCAVYCPHTTAGITINENADSDVVTDLLFAFDKTFPDRPDRGRLSPFATQRAIRRHTQGKLHRFECDGYYR